MWMLPGDEGSEQIRQTGREQAFVGLLDLRNRPPAVIAGDGPLLLQAIAKVDLNGRRVDDEIAAMEADGFIRERDRVLVGRHPGTELRNP